MSGAVVKHVRGLFRAVASPAPTLPQPDESEFDDPIPVPYELLFDSPAFFASGSGCSFNGVNAQQQPAMRVAAEPANPTHSRFFVSPISLTDVFHSGLNCFLIMYTVEGIE